MTVVWCGRAVDGMTVMGQQQNACDTLCAQNRGWRFSSFLERDNAGTNDFFTSKDEAHGLCVCVCVGGDITHVLHDLCEPGLARVPLDP